MVAHPGQLLITFLLGLATLPILASALYLLYKAHAKRVVELRPAAPGNMAVLHADVTRDRPHKALLIAIALAMLAWVFAGKYLVLSFYPSGEPARPGEPAASASVRGASGAALNVRTFGPPGAPVLILTHGWGADSRAWDYAVTDLSKQFQVVTWDLPGLGGSSPMSGDYSMAAFAADLDSVVSSLQGQPVILAGHSIGGMINLEYARRFPDKLGRQVRGIAQVNTTYTNPVETKKNAERSMKLQKPVFEPLLHVVTWTAPVMRALGWFAYQSGLAHLQLAGQSFAGAETREQLDFMARYAYRSSPAVVARGALAMLHWDASDVLKGIKVPTLVISGDQDVTTLPVASDHMASTIPNATSLSVSPAAHLGPIEQHQRYAEALAGFAGKRMQPSKVAGVR